MIRFLIRIVLELLWYDRQHVGILETKTFHIEGIYDQKVEYVAWIHCYETRWGTRSTRFSTAKVGLLSRTNFIAAKRITKNKIYQTEVLPWLQGRAHNEIPSYQKVKSNRWDFLKKLKGETPIVLNDDEK